MELELVIVLDVELLEPVEEDEVLVLTGPKEKVSTLPRVAAASVDLEDEPEVEEVPFELEELVELPVEVGDEVEDELCASTCGGVSKRSVARQKRSSEEARVKRIFAV